VTWAGLTKAGLLGSRVTGAGLAWVGLAGAGLAGAGLAGAGLADAGLTGSGVTEAGVAQVGLAEVGLMGRGWLAGAFARDEDLSGTGRGRRGRGALSGGVVLAQVRRFPLWSGGVLAERGGNRLGAGPVCAGLLARVEGAVRASEPRRLGFRQVERRQVERRRVEWRTSALLVLAVLNGESWQAGEA